VERALVVAAPRAAFTFDLTDALDLGLGAILDSFDFGVGMKDRLV
jgi:hypothetical protein